MTYRVGYAQLAGDRPFVQKVTEGLLQAAGKARVEILVTDNQNSPEEALRNARWLISQRVDFMIEHQFHHRVGPVLADMFSKANIPCVAIDIPQPGAIYFGVDNYSAGYLGGKTLAQFAAKKWGGRVEKVLMLEIPEAGHVPQSRISGTLEGIREVLPKLEEEIVLHKNGKGTETGSYSTTRSVIRALKSRDRLLIAAANGYSARGAIRAIREAHREKFTAIVAQGWGPDDALEAELVRPSGPLIGSVAYFPEKYGPAILSVVLRSLNGQPVPPAVYTEHKLISNQLPHGRG